MNVNSFLLGSIRMFEPIFEPTQDAVIKVIGVGGGGGNALNHMVESSSSENIGSVEFFFCKYRRSGVTQ